MAFIVGGALCWLRLWHAWRTALKFKNGVPPGVVLLATIVGVFSLWIGPKISKLSTPQAQAIVKNLIATFQYLALSLTLVAGTIGQISLGHAGLLAIGAYVLQGQVASDGPRLFAQVMRMVEQYSVDSLTNAQIYEKAARARSRASTASCARGAPALGVVVVRSSFVCSRVGGASAGLLS